ncbi:xylose isomerase-like TIM barrel [bacterium BMS3Bbin14]|nr:xylose isomerase-like TIM barrel [bacterium BMS3Abin13]GBE52830.1 xylose isomerase-like TIM barrel [bacterium BMS3Bbin14]HDK44189.1 sugar phosphate isomerase/epimerase [Desulfobacteraceae bacterium]
MKTPYAHITDYCFINAPFALLRAGLLELFLKNRLQPEIGLEGECLWDTEKDVFRQTADTLKRHNLSCTLHAPFSDLAPGGFDSRIRALTREKLRLAFELIPVFNPRSIVCHLGFEENKHSYKLDTWLENALETWQELLDIAEHYQTPVMFENTYETSPMIHRTLFAELNSPVLGFCLDVGHLMAFADTPWQVWLDEDAVGSRLGQLHLHDNLGNSDDHLAIGRGNFNFDELFDYLRDHRLSPLITLEPHSEEDLWRSLAAIDAADLFRGIIRQ